MNLEEHFLAHYRPLCLYALHYVQDVDTAEDVVQDAFVGLIEKEKEGAAVGNVRAYLYAMVRNRCVDLIRKARHAYIDGDVSPQDLSGSISDEEAQERSLHEAELWTAIDALPSRCREVFLRAKRDTHDGHSRKDRGTPDEQGTEDAARQERRLLLHHAADDGMRRG